MRRGAWATSRAPWSRWTSTSGDMLAFVSMPAFDPNSFSEGIGRTEWKMLSENDHIPLLNKVAQGLYPSGSTIKPAMALAFLKQGIDPKRRVVCTGRLPDRQPLLPLRCGPRIDGHALGDRAQLQHLFLGDRPDHRPRADDRDGQLPRLRRGIRPADPDPALRDHAQPQMAGKEIPPQMAGLRFRQHVDRPGLCPHQPDAARGHAGAARVGKAAPAPPADGQAAKADPQRSTSIPRISPSFATRWPRSSTSTAPPSASKLPLDGIRWPARPAPPRCSASASAGIRAPGPLRDHALFIAFAPADKPRYAIGCIIEHGGFGASAAAPIVRDSMTYLFDQQKAWAALAPLEQQWGGTLAERNARELAAFKSASRADAHDHLRHHPAAAGAAALALDLSGRRRSPAFGVVILYSAAGGSVQPWALKQGIVFLFFLGVAIGMSWIRESTIKAVVFPAYVRDPRSAHRRRWHSASSARAPSAGSSIGPIEPPAVGVHEAGDRRSRLRASTSFFPRERSAAGAASGRPSCSSASPPS